MDTMLEFLPTLFLFVLDVSWTILTILIVLVGAYAILDVLFGKPAPAAKTKAQSNTKKDAILYDGSDADEAQRRFLQESLRAHEESVHLYQAAVREAEDTHQRINEQQQTFMEMHHDFNTGGCDLWF